MKFILFHFPQSDEANFISPPLNYAAICGYLLKKAIPFYLIDERVISIKKSKLKSLLAKASFVATSAITGRQVFHAVKFLKMVKKISPSTRTVLGGWHASLYPGITLECVPEIDILVSGCGEEVLEKIYYALEFNKDPETHGISFSKIKFEKSREQIIVTSKREPVFSNYPLELLRKPYFKNKAIKRFQYITSRGCVRNCGFCASSSFYKKVYFKPLKIVKEDLARVLKLYKVEEIGFEDDSFFSNKSRAFEILEFINYVSPFTKWYSNISVKELLNFSKQDLIKLKKLNCSKLMIGLESFSNRILKLINKPHLVQEALKCAELLAEIGIKANFSIMVGFPTETPSELNTTLKNIYELKKLNRNNIIPVYFYLPYPGTPLYNFALRSGYKPPATLEEFYNLNTRNWESPFIIKKLRDNIDAINRLYIPVLLPSSQLQKRINTGILTKILFNFLKFIAHLRLKTGIMEFKFEWKFAKFLRKLQVKLTKWYRCGFTLR